MNFLTQYFTADNFIFIAIMVTGITAGVYFKFITPAMIKTLADQFMQEAEDWLNTKAGQEKLNWVIDKVYEALPSLAKIIFTKQKIKTITEKLFELFAVEVEIDGITHTVYQGKDHEQ